MLGLYSKSFNQTALHHTLPPLNSNQWISLLPYTPSPSLPTPSPHPPLPLMPIGDQELGDLAAALSLERVFVCCEMHILY